MATILIIEDNRKNLKFFTDILEFHHYEVRFAMTGEDGYQAAVSEKVDMILLDIQLPDMDGLEVIKRIRTNPAISNVSVIAVTSYAMDEDREKAFKAGCDDYITKPIEVGLLVETIKKFIE